MLTLNRPDRLNAWTAEMEHAYFGLLEECAASPEVRVIVVTGAGTGLLRGRRHAGPAGARRRRRGRRGSTPHEDADRRRATRCRSPSRSSPRSTAPCAGIGLVQALMCDMRFAAEGAKLTTAFARRGLVAEHGISWMLPRLVGPARALDLLLSGRVVLAEEACGAGARQPRAAPGAAARADARRTRASSPCSCSPASMATMKRQVYADLDRGLPRGARRGRPADARVVHRPRLRRGRRELRRAARPRFAAIDGLAAASSGSQPHAAQLDRVSASRAVARGAAPSRSRMIPSSRSLGRPVKATSPPSSATALARSLSRRPPRRAPRPSARRHCARDRPPQP